MKAILLLLTLVVSRQGFCQKTDSSKAISFQRAMFPGGDDSLQVYIDEHKTYRKTAIHDKVEGEVTVGIIIDNEGKIRKVDITKSLHPGLDSSITQLMQLMPDWIPAYENGKPVFSQLSLNINFELRDTINSIKKDTAIIAKFGGELSQFLANNLQYPTGARDSGITGKAYATFVVDERGGIRWLKILKSSGSKSLDNEVLRVIGLTNGLWKPSIYRDKPIKSFFTLPINFMLD